MKYALRAGSMNSARILQESCMISLISPLQWAKIFRLHNCLSKIVKLCYYTTMQGYLTLTLRCPPHFALIVALSETAVLHCIKPVMMTLNVGVNSIESWVLLQTDALSIYENDWIFSRSGI